MKAVKLVLPLLVMLVAAATAVAHAQEAAAGANYGAIGAGLAIGISGFGAGIAVGRIGAVSVSVIAEKPELFGRTLVYVALGEGIAIYGLLIAILLIF
ncbi:MAG: ATP synthase subunit C [Thermoproteota archaeon]